MSKKAKIVTENLVNYSLMIMVSAIVFFALVYFGFLDIERFLPEHASLAPGLIVQTMHVDDAEITLRVYNALDRDINNLTLAGVKCEEKLNSRPVSINSRATSTIRISCIGPVPGRRFVTELKGSYIVQTNNQKITHGIDGYLRSDAISSIESGRITHITECTEIDKRGIYILNNNINISGTCFKINSDDVILDLNWHDVRGDGRIESYGIYIENQKEVTIQNARIFNFENGIYLKNSNNNVIENSEIISNYIGIRIQDSSQNSFRAILSCNSSFSDFACLNSHANIDSGTNLFDRKTGCEWWMENSTIKCSDILNIG